MHDKMGVIIVATHETCSLAFGQTIEADLNILLLAIRLESQSWLGPHGTETLARQFLLLLGELIRDSDRGGKG